MNQVKHAQRRQRIGSGLKLLAVAACAVVALAGCGDKDKASQTAAKVNDDEITVHQINFVLSHQQGIKPEQADAAGKQVLERLIDQQLAVQKAESLKLDRDPAVVQQIEAAKSEIIARAYAAHVGEGVAKPTPEEISKYFDDNPALFKNRRVYNLQDIMVEAPAERFDEIRAKVDSAKSVNDFIEYLKGAGLRFSGNQIVRPAEQLPLGSLNAIAQMKDGDKAITRLPTGLNVLYLASSREQPVSLEQARPAIEAYLLNQRRTEAVKKDIAGLRTQAKIEYVGKFAAPAASGAASGAAPVVSAEAPAATPAASAAASDLSNTDISKGLGIK